MMASKMEDDNNECAANPKVLKTGTRGMHIK